MMISFGCLLILGMLLVTLPLQAFAAVSRCACAPHPAGVSMDMDHYLELHGGISAENHLAGEAQHASHGAYHQHKTSCVSVSCAACSFFYASLALTADTATVNPAWVHSVGFAALSLLHSSAFVDLLERPRRGILM